mmetsp:Transcript_15585/g.41920  ORF Transcript_15585/g.41920 Transcript_15585/m.41920 type:complete len:241 (-) Transcript_15585:252-974(-)
MALDNFRQRFALGIAEMLGTAILVFVIQLAVTSGSSLAPLAIGLGLVAIVYAIAPISGAHVNPAVTLSIFLRGKSKPADAIMYWFAQLVGGVVGALLGLIVGGESIAPAIGKGHNFMQAFLAELIITSILCFVVLAVATSKAAEKNSWYGLSIGIVVFFGAVSVGGISGGSFNPAVTFGLCFVKGIRHFAFAAWTVLAQLLGGVLGAFFYYLVAPADFEHFGENVGDLKSEAKSLLPGGK